MNMEAHTSNMPCNMASLNWTEEDIKKIEKRQEFYSFLTDNYDTSLIAEAIMELNEEGKLALKDEIEDHKDEIIEKLEKLKTKNVDHKDEIIEKLEKTIKTKNMDNNKEELQKAKKRLNEALYNLKDWKINSLDLGPCSFDIQEDDCTLTIYRIDDDGTLYTDKTNSKLTINAFDLKIIDNINTIAEKAEDMLTEYLNNMECDAGEEERKPLTEEQYKELAHDINENVKKQLDQLYGDSGEFAPVFEKFEATKLDLSDATIYGPKNSNEDGEDLCGTDGENELVEEDKDTFDSIQVECDFENSCDCGGTFERCNDTAPCCGGLDDIPDVYDYLTDDMFPAEATEKDKYNKYVRRTPWTEVESYNKNNKKIVDDYIKYFRENFPDRAKDKTDIEILSENDDIWEKGLYDDILLNSLKNGDYVLDTYSDEGYRKGGLKGKDRHDVLANFDVVIDCTLVGYVCRPYIVFGISKQHSWMANSVDDDYTKEELRKISDLSGPKNDEELRWWRTEGVYKYHEREIELYKEGHIRFEIKDLGTEYRQYIRKVDHKAEKHKVTHDIW